MCVSVGKKWDLKNLHNLERNLRFVTKNDFQDFLLFPGQFDSDKINE